MNTTFIVSQFSVALVAERRGRSGPLVFVSDGLALAVLYIISASRPSVPGCVLLRGLCWNIMPWQGRGMNAGIVRSRCVNEDNYG